MKRAIGSPRGSFKIILGFHTDHKSHRDMTGSQNILKPIANSEPAQGSGWDHQIGAGEVNDLQVCIALSSLILFLCNRSSPNRCPHINTCLVFYFSVSSPLHPVFATLCVTQECKAQDMVITIIKFATNSQLSHARSNPGCFIWSL